ncbi:plasmid recombination enzyme [Salmonella enterica]|nr:plasmid recombination enzyme [Salmonella enterica subsp. enterica serovar Adelaide]ECX5442719.1 plasmid recombination enzyme [Salmonella enterica]
MAAYAIMRCKKLSGMGSVAAALQHCYRERGTPNADASRTPDNEHRAARSTDEAMGRLRKLLPEKRRKDAVLAVEYVMTASPEWWAKATPQQQAAFFDQAQGWLAAKYGADRIITASIHRDEATPHLSAFVVPLTQDGRLSAKEFIGGRDKMRADQTSFAEAVRDLGLERGIEGSRATHQRVRSYYGAIERQPAHVTISPQALEPRVLRKGFFSKDVETPEAVADRLTKAVRQGYAPAVEAAKLAESERRRAAEMTRTAQTLSKEKKEAQERLQDLQKHLAPVLDLAELDKQEFARLVTHAHARVNAIKAERQRAAEREKIAQERQRRVNDLARVERTKAGAACTFAQHALEAVQKAGGDASKVDWKAVEKAAIIESIAQHRQHPKDVLAAIVKYSPGMVEPARQEQARAFISTLAGKEIAAPKVGKQHDGPSLG